MNIDQSAVGRATAPQEYVVEPGAIRKFAEAIGDANPLYVDAAYARACGYPAVLAPPTFPTTFRGGLPVTFDGAHILHGEQAYRYTRPIVAGETITCTTTLTGVRERRGTLGRMTLVDLETTGRDAAGQEVFVGVSTTILY
jgi:acyl dehydratase